MNPKCNHKYPYKAGWLEADLTIEREGNMPVKAEFGVMCFEDGEK